MNGQYMDYYAAPNGSISVRRLIDGTNWRQAVDINDTDTLDSVAPDMPDADRLMIAQLWASLPPSQ